MNINIYEVINAVAPNRLITHYPGPGLGVTAYRLTPYLNKGKQLGVETKFIELAGEIKANICVM